MAIPPLDGPLDHLYQLPLDEFTTARNGLAKSTGDASIKKLEKPNLAAWAVNQLFWQKRKLYDEVIKTSGQLRTAYKQMLAGKSADVRAAEVFHNEAMRKAKDAIRSILESAGHSAVDGVMTPITETLDALPTTDPPGRLTKRCRASRSPRDPPGPSRSSNRRSRRRTRLSARARSAKRICKSWR